jgi:hypothetical protein
MRFQLRLLIGIAVLGCFGSALAGCSNNVRSTPVHYSVGVGVGAPWWGYGPRYHYGGPIYVGGGGGGYPDVDIPEAVPLPSAGFEDYGGFDDF